jgi:zinc finger FYVE domain-containing protein 26
VLLEFLIFMKDNIRTALTYIKLFHEEMDLGVQVSHLQNAKAHFQEANNDQEKSSKILSLTEINRYLTTLSLQIQVTQFFDIQVKSNLITLSSVQSLTLFGNVQQKTEIAELLLVLYSFELAFQIIQHFQLPMKQIYIDSLSQIARKKQINKISDFLKYIKGTINDIEWDEILLACISVISKENFDPKSAEKFVGKLVEPENKIKGFILSDKLKAAYLLAVKIKSTKFVKEIQQEAQQKDKTVYDLCQRWLEQYSFS